MDIANRVFLRSGKAYRQSFTKPNTQVNRAFVDVRYWHVLLKNSLSLAITPILGILHR
jgi:hypothetical protein